MNNNKGIKIIGIALIIYLIYISYSRIAMLFKIIKE